MPLIYAKKVDEIRSNQISLKFKINYSYCTVYHCNCSYQNLWKMASVIRDERLNEKLMINNN